MGLRNRSSFKSETLYFVTTTIVNFAPVFTENKYCDLLIHNIKHYQERYGFKILGYVIMPSHLHWVIEIQPKLGSISDIMRDIKKYSAWDLMEALERDNQTGLFSLFLANAKELQNQRRKFWMKRLDDQVIRTIKMLQTKLEYIHHNPVKAGLVDTQEDYKYSSARNYRLNDHSVIRVVTDWS